MAVVVRVPSHYEPTKAAIEAGKHVYTEWPLGRTTAEAEELATLARAKGVHTAVGLQSRVSPALLYIKELIENGYVGEVLSCHVTTFRDGALERLSTSTWQRDASLCWPRRHRNYSARRKSIDPYLGSISRTRVAYRGIWRVSSANLDGRHPGSPISTRKSDRFP